MRDKKAKSFVTVMVIIAICALLLRVLIDKAVKFYINQNESNASSTLKLVSAALENYAEDNQGVYPQNFLALTQSNPAYLDKNYIAQSPWRGYNYGCARLEASGYICHATPIRCDLTGNTVFTVTTGGLLVSEKCERKEQD